MLHFPHVDLDLRKVDWAVIVDVWYQVDLVYILGKDGSGVEFGAGSGEVEGTTVVSAAAEAEGEEEEEDDDDGG